MAHGGNRSENLAGCERLSHRLWSGEAAGDGVGMMMLMGKMVMVLDVGSGKTLT